MSNPFLAPTLPDELPDNPMDWANAWLEEASAQQVQRNPNSMTLGTVSADGRPSARVVLCKAFVTDPGYVVFYTNYQSQKVVELKANPHVAATFHWDAIGRQIRLEGQAVLSPASESDGYFASRDRGSQIGAWGSDQSAPIASRQALKNQVQSRAGEFGVDVGNALPSIDGQTRAESPRPPHWGGIRIWPQKIELWLEGADRIHDRAAWQRVLTPDGDHDFNVGNWAGQRLQP
ncbi:MAG: pyridoxamine 5'-phosphate oxidase [Woeseiaceae bacterium]